LSGGWGCPTLGSQGDRYQAEAIAGKSSQNDGNQDVAEAGVGVGVHQCISRVDDNTAAQAWQVE